MARARRGLEECWREVEAAGRGGLIQHVDTLLLPCLAHDGDWEAWDERMARVRAFEPGHTRVDYDSIACLERAANLANAAGEYDRAAEARRLAAAQRRAQDG